MSANDPKPTWLKLTSWRVPAHIARDFLFPDVQLDWRPRRVRTPCILKGGEKMKIGTRFGLSCLLAATLCVRSGWAATDKPPVTSDPKAAEITILYDAFGKPSAMKKDWGFSALIEYRGKRILFDTGNNAEIFAHNVKAKGIDLDTLDFVVVSHRHGDHTSGLNHLLRVNPDVTIYAPQENFGVFGAALPATFYKPNKALPADKRYFDGNPPETLRFGSAWPDGKFTWVAENTEVAPGFHLIILPGLWGVDLEVKEISLAIDTPDGLVLVVGCGHPKIEAIVEATTAALDKPIHLVIGGLHLLPASKQEIRRIATALRDNWDVQFIAPDHCTGERGFAILKEVFGDRYVYAGLGTTLQLGPTVTIKAEARQLEAPTMEAADLWSYRQSLAQGPLRPLLGRGGDVLTRR
jgi:7,8-dihydropterin-6-yl-methyl-4-(beta-D-ribofuranosyl)aminobenzene 5'-phosphate synthase